MFTTTNIFSIRNRTSIALLALLLSGVSPGELLAADRYDIVASTGDVAGGTSGVFSSFSRPAINNEGQLAYRGDLLIGTGGVITTNSVGLWRDNTLVVRTGNNAGGTSGVFSGFGGLNFNNQGQLAYQAHLLNGTGGVTSSNNFGLWRDNTLVARSGSIAGDTTGVFSAFNPPALNAAGQVAYLGVLVNGTGGVTSSNTIGLWRDNALVARTGSSASGTTGTFSSLGSHRINNQGQLAYRGDLLIGTGGVTLNNAVGLWRDTTLIARTGDTAGGTSGIFSNFGTPSINNQGQLAYAGNLLKGSGGVTESNDRGLWRDTTLVAREGSNAGGTDGVFSSFLTPLLNNQGQVVYQAFLLDGTGGVTTTNDRGVWLDSTLLAREGSRAAGTYSGEVFSDIYTGLLLNDGGQVAFRGSLRPNTGGVSSTNNEGLWLYGPNGDGLLVAREGDSFDGKTLLLSSIIISSGSGDGRQTGLNEFGQLAYRAVFTDASEALVLYTPEIHWTANFSSNWDSSSRWTLAIRPGDPHDVFIDPTSSLTVFGPGNDVTMRTLTIGGGSGVGTLDLGFGAITTTDGTAIATTGVLNGDGVIHGGVTNAGEVHAENVTINGGLINNGLVRGSTGQLARINAKLVNNVGGEVRVGLGESLHLSGSEHTNSGRVEVNSGELGLAGTLNNVSGAKIFADNATLRFADEVVNNAGAQIFADNSTLRFDATLNNRNGAQIFADNATLHFDGGLANNGQLNVTFGGASLFGNIAIDSLGQIILSGNSNTTFFDDLTNKGELRVSPGSVTTFFGDVSGPGNYTGTGTKFYEALFSPGASPGLVTDDGDAMFGASAVVVMEIGGTQQGIDYDHYDVAGLLGLNGTLVISLLDGYTPGEGEVFDLFDWGTLSGTFSEIDLTAALLTNGLSWDLSQLYSNGALSVSAAPVPLPAGLWLMVSAIGVLVTKRRVGRSTP